MLHVNMVLHALFIFERFAACLATELRIYSALVLEMPPEVPLMLVDLGTIGANSRFLWT